MAMLNEQDFDSIFSSFSNGSQGSGIKEVYNIMPYLTETQMKIYIDGIYFSEKWQIPEIRSYLESIVQLKKQNRSLGFLPSVKQFMKYSTLDEKVRNVKIQSTNNGDQ